MLCIHVALRFPDKKVTVHPYSHDYKPQRRLGWMLRYIQEHISCIKQVS